MTASTNFSAGTVYTSAWGNAVDQAVFDDVIDVKLYGATGNGTDDDYAAIMTALAALPNGGMLYFPPGTYIISQCILLPVDNLYLKGARGAVIKLKAGAVGTLTHGSMISFFQKLNITIEGLEIDGNKANNDINDNYGNGINCYDSQRVRILNNYVHDCPRDGISLSDYTRINPGTAIGLEDILVSGNLVLRSGSTSQTTGGEGILCVQGTRIEIVNNICTGNKYRGIEIETLTTVIKNLICAGNICNSNTVTGIGVNGASKLLVTNNICEGNTTYGIYVNSSVPITAGEFIISHNRISGGTYGISIDNYTGVLVNANTITGPTKGLYYLNVSDIASNNNIISNCVQHGVDFLTGTNTRLTFSGNFIKNSNQGGGAYDNATGNSTYVIFHGNFVTGASARYGINTAGSGWSICDNILDLAGATALINDGATATRIRDNGGFITEAAGLATITSATTSVTVSHGCSKTPALGHISVVFGEDPTTSPGAMYISNITSTQFTINTEVAPGASNLDLGWKVQIV